MFDFLIDDETEVIDTWVEDGLDCMLVRRWNEKGTMDWFCGYVATPTQSFMPYIGEHTYEIDYERTVGSITVWGYATRGKQNRTVEFQRKEIKTLAKNLKGIYNFFEHFEQWLDGYDLPPVLDGVRVELQVDY